MDLVTPRKLRPGDQIRVVAPSRSRAIISAETSSLATSRLEGLGFRVSFGEHVDAHDIFDSSPITGRVADLHAAFADPDVAAVLTVLGGYSANELLPYLDWDLIGANPKVFSGFSNASLLSNAIHARTGMLTYVGPHWSTFGMRLCGEETRDWFLRTVTSDEPVEVRPSAWFSDDAWYLDQDARVRRETDGWWVLREGGMQGRVIGGNLTDLSSLRGTPAFPDLAGAVLFLEDAEQANAVEVRRELHAMLQMPGAEHVQGLVIGRFQLASAVTREHVEQIVDSLPNLDGKPVMANVDFGHTVPMATLPIGGHARVVVGAEPSVTFDRH